MQPTQMQIIATVLFVIAVLHTFLAPKLAIFADKYKPNDWQACLLHLLSEVEIVFAFWSLIFFIYLSVTQGLNSVVDYISNASFTEPTFVFIVMFMASTKPIIRLTEVILINISKLLPFDKKLAFYLTTLVVGPLLGSLITEPAAMTVCAMILLEKFFAQKMSTKFKYATIGLLFVNVSIGGTLTHFAAPPIVMVASKFGWDSAYIFSHFGYKSMLSVIISTTIYAIIFRKELTGNVSMAKPKESGKEPGWWLILLHVLFLILVVLTSHHMSFIICVFFVFLAFVSITQQYQHKIELKPSLMVGIFLAGLVLLGQPQAWWLGPLLGSISDLTLYFGATTLTAITDNAALTYLGSLVDLTDSAKYFLVAGAVTGGGLTVIANAPNPAGYGILKKTFPKGIISPLLLLLAALGPTIVTILCFELL